jgi:hypothetical protein
MSVSDIEFGQFIQLIIEDDEDVDWSKLCRILFSRYRDFDSKLGSGVYKGYTLKEIAEKVDSCHFMNELFGWTDNVPKISPSDKAFGIFLQLFIEDDVSISSPMLSTVWNYIENWDESLPCGRYKNMKLDEITEFKPISCE